MKMLILGDVVPTTVTDPLFKKKDIETLFGDTVSLFQDTLICTIEDIVLSTDGFRIVTPFASQGTPLQEDGGSYSRTVVGRKMLNFCYVQQHAIKFLSLNIPFRFVQ